MLQRETLRRLWPSCPPDIIDGTAKNAARVFKTYGFEKPLEVAVLMAHVSHECGAGHELVENLNYTASRIVAVWPSRFSSVAAAMPYQHNPQKLANKVYNGRMGNRTGSDDGWNFRGRGGTNTTGHDGYHALALHMALDLLSDPDKVNDPDWFLECAVVDFILCNCLEPAKVGDMRLSCRRLNGGYTGLEERKTWFRRWQSALAAEHGGEAVAVPVPARDPRVIAQYGDENAVVKGIQQKLNDKGYSCGECDGSFHEATEAAVNSFKSDNGLPSDGKVDQVTVDALNHAPDRPVSEKRSTATTDDLREKGSRTIQSSDLISYYGKIKIWLGSIGIGSFAAFQTKLQTGIESIDHLKDQVLPFFSSPVVLAVCAVLIVLGIVIIYEARKVVAARLDDHRSAANLGR